jgi:hypothetical protein
MDAGAAWHGETLTEFIVLGNNSSLAPLIAQQQIERLSRLPKAKQKFVMEMLEGVLGQASR